MEFKLSLFPFWTKFLGLVMMFLALPFAYLYFWGGRPEFFNIKTFAIVTSYAETRYFVIIQTNLLDELAAILFLVGITLFSFSKEKVEKSNYESLRIKALISALYLTIVLWVLSFLFVYGKMIFVVSFFVFVILLINYNLIFRYFLFKNK